MIGMLENVRWNKRSVCGEKGPHANANGLGTRGSGPRKLRRSVCDRKWSAHKAEKSARGVKGLQAETLVCARSASDQKRSTRGPDE